MTSSSGPSNNTFKIGLALSGAISAGAYTSGVLDFLFQALSEWEKARNERHRVVLQVAAGASAGAISGALGAVALAHGMQPRQFSQEETNNSYRAEGRNYQNFRCVLPTLYNTWVEWPRMVDPAGGIDLLSNEDVKDGNNPVVSVLNSKLLECIKKKALLGSGQSGRAEPAPPYPYIAETLHVYMTVSNLRGLPFTLAFGNSTYGMQTHSDRAHYAVRGLGGGPTATNKWLNADSYPKEITIAELNQDTVPEAWDEYGTWALASSAFPVGLAPRLLKVPFTHFDRPYPIRGGAHVIKPRFPDQAAGDFAFLNVDGGVINNNPFDYAQFALMGDASAEKTSGTEADRAVIMVSPFPEPPAFLPEGKPPAELVAVVQALYPALINQARFKVEELVPALDRDDHSRFLIAPHRKLPGSNQEERYTIACGLLGGFGGFLDEGFRAHDFQLGRRNCQAFLRSVFSLAANNQIVSDIAGQPEFQAPADPTKYAILPLAGEAALEVPLPHWPRMTQADFETLLRRIEGRLDDVAPRLVQAQTKSRLLRTIGYLGLRTGKDRVLEYVRLAILSDLVRRDQIEGWELPDWARKRADDVRAVLAELASPAFTFRTAEGIAKHLHLSRQDVDQVLGRLQDVNRGKPYAVWRREYQGRQVYTLASRQTGFWSLPGIRQLGNFIEEPVVDPE